MISKKMKASVRGMGSEPTDLKASPVLLRQVLSVNLNVCLDLTLSAYDELRQVLYGFRCFLKKSTMFV